MRVDAVELCKIEKSKGCMQGCVNIRVSMEGRQFIFAKNIIM